MGKLTAWPTVGVGEVSGTATSNSPFEEPQPTHTTNRSDASQPRRRGKKQSARGRTLTGRPQGS